MITGIMGYNRQTNRYGLINRMDLWEIDGFHCGAAIDVWDYDNEQWITARMGKHYHAPYLPHNDSDSWYLIGTPYSGTALEGLKIRVKSE